MHLLPFDVIDYSCNNNYFPVELLQGQWIPGKTRNPNARVFKIKPNSEWFSKYFDLVQEQLETLASMDDLLSGTNVIVNHACHGNDMYIIQYVCSKWQRTIMFGSMEKMKLGSAMACI